MSEDCESIAKRIHAMYLPNDCNCSFRSTDWYIAREIAELRAEIAQLQARLTESENLSDARRHWWDCAKERAEKAEAELAQLQAEKGMADMGFVSVGARAVIDRLKAELAEARTYSHKSVRGLVGWRDDKIAQLQAENDRYKGALKRLVCLGNGSKPGNSDGNIIAQRALKGGEKQDPPTFDIITDLARKSKKASKP